MHFFSFLHARKIIVSLLVWLLAIALALILLRGAWLIFLIDVPYYWTHTDTANSVAPPAGHYISSSYIPTEVDATITLTADQGPAAYLQLFRKYILNPSAKPKFLLVTSDNHSREHHLYISSHSSDNSPKKEIVKIEILNVPHIHERAYPNRQLVSR